MKIYQLFSKNTLGGIASICFRFYFQQTLQMQIQGKCFTYLTKTRANSTTYSRKPGNFNGTISFEIDIMKNSSPINLNLGQTWLFHICFGCFFCFDLLWRWAESPVSPAEKKCYFGFDMAKIVNFKLSGDEFFMMSISKIMVPL